jgi:hypothetical protein
MASAEKLREIFSLIEKLEEYSFEIGPIRPPSEGGSYSLLIRVTRNCPWRLVHSVIEHCITEKNFS